MIPKKHLSAMNSAVLALAAAAVIGSGSYSLTRAKETEVDVCDNLVGEVTLNGYPSNDTYVRQRPYMTAHQFYPSIGNPIHSSFLFGLKLEELLKLENFSEKLDKQKMEMVKMREDRGDEYPNLYKNFLKFNEELSIQIGNSEKKVLFIDKKYGQLETEDDFSQLNKAVECRTPVILIEKGDTYTDKCYGKHFVNPGEYFISPYGCRLGFAFYKKKLSKTIFG